MALIHPHSSESVNTGLDLFSMPPTQTSLETGQFVEYHPLAAITQGSPIEFTVRGAGEEYLDLGNTYLHVRAKIVNADGTATGKDVVVGPVNYWLHALFSQVDISLNDTVVTDSTLTYPYRAYIEAALSYGNEAKKGYMTSAMYYRDTPGKFDDMTEENKGFAMRRAKSTGGREIDMYGRLHSDICAQDRFILNGVDVKFRLTPSKHSFNQMSDHANPTTTIITRASLFVRKVKLNPAVALAHAKALEKTTAKYPLNRVTVKTFSIPKGNMSVTQDNLFLTQLPKRLVVGLVNSEGYLGDYKRHPFLFDTFGLTYLSLSVSGKMIPQTPLTPDFKNKHYVRSYFHQGLGLGYQQQSDGNGISYDDFAAGYSLFVWDLSANISDGNQIELVRTGSLRLELKFAEALPHPIHVVVYGELDSLLEIDRNRQILADFAS